MASGYSIFNSFEMFVIFLTYRSEATGNCLYSSVSLALVGDNSLTKPLRILTSFELFLHANFYSKHSVFLYTFSKRLDDIYTCFNNLLSMCVPFHVVDSRLQGDDIIIMEATPNSQDKRWTVFLCILALSSVIS